MLHDFSYKGYKYINREKVEWWAVGRGELGATIQWVWDFLGKMEEFWI